jgi:acetyl-CoA carboxylase alpha subunit
MLRLGVPTVSCIIGEGGSGGAVAIAVADRVLMQENAIYSVISPEGCAAILWRDAGEAKKAAAAFKPDAAHCLELGVIDGVVPEPPGGAHESTDAAATILGESLEIALEEVKKRGTRNSVGWGFSLSEERFAPCFPQHPQGFPRPDKTFAQGLKAGSHRP